MIKRIAKLTLLVIALGVLWQRSQLAALALTCIDPLPETRELVASVICAISPSRASTWHRARKPTR